MVELRSWSKALGAKVNNSNGKDLSINDDDDHDDDDDDRDVEMIMIMKIIRKGCVERDVIFWSKQSKQK